MKAHQIIITQSRRGAWSVEADGLIEDEMCWEEMLGQIATLTHPDIKAPRFPMMTKTEAAMRRWEWYSQNDPCDEPLETEIPF